MEDLLMEVVATVLVVAVLVEATVALRTAAAEEEEQVTDNRAMATAGKRAAATVLDQVEVDRTEAPTSVPIFRRSTLPTLNSKNSKRTSTSNIQT